MLKTENCEWQKLVDSAYRRWYKHDDEIDVMEMEGQLSKVDAAKIRWSYSDMLGNVPLKLRKACILGKMNYQIENGGCYQWVDNGYCEDAVNNGILDLLKNLGPVGVEVAGIIRTVILEIMDDEGQAIDGSWDISDELSKRFLKLQDEWHKEVYKYFEN